MVTRSAALPDRCPHCGAALAYDREPWSDVLLIRHGAGLTLFADARAITHGPPYTLTPEAALAAYHGEKDE